MTPEQIAHALDPLKVVDAKALDDLAKSLKNSKSKQKRAVGVFLDRINRYRLDPSNQTPTPGKSSPPPPKTGLRDLTD